VLGIVITFVGLAIVQLRDARLGSLLRRRVEADRAARRHAAERGHDRVRLSCQAFQRIAFWLRKTLALAD
jgi:hypothetical protein